MQDTGQFVHISINIGMYKKKEKNVLKILFVYSLETLLWNSAIKKLNLYFKNIYILNSNIYFKLIRKNKNIYHEMRSSYWLYKSIKI